MVWHAGKADLTDSSEDFYERFSQIVHPRQ
jgi:hypothetical protein